MSVLLSAVMREYARYKFLDDRVVLRLGGAPCAIRPRIRNEAELAATLRIFRSPQFVRYNPLTKGITLGEIRHISQIDAGQSGLSALYFLAVLEMSESSLKKGALAGFLTVEDGEETFLNVLSVIPPDIAKQYSGYSRVFEIGYAKNPEAESGRMRKALVTSCLLLWHMSERVHLGQEWKRHEEGKIGSILAVDPIIFLRIEPTNYRSVMLAKRAGFEKINPLSLIDRTIKGHPQFDVYVLKWQRFRTILTSPGLKESGDDTEKIIPINFDDTAGDEEIIE